MKQTGSREKPIQNQTTTLNRTQQNPPKIIGSQTEVRPSSGRKIESAKSIQPPSLPGTKKTIKVQYIVEDNMTESRINQAKNGLQLLKKKLSSKGMSREKLQPHREPIKEKVAEDYQEKTKPTPPIESTKKITAQIPSSKQIGRQTKPAQQKRQEPLPISSKNIKNRSEFINEKQEEVIKPKGHGDFMALLEMEMRKQNQNLNNGNRNQRPNEKTPKHRFDEQQQEIGELTQCSKGCGRKFNPEVLVKHEKVCQKVFQSKRKAFNSAQFRKPEVQGIPNSVPAAKQPPLKPAKKSTKQIEKPSTTTGKVPKWKIQSAQFRAGLQAVSGKQITAEQKKILQQNDTRVECTYCGRKFAQKAAERHIPFCQEKSKQMPKMNTTMKKK